MNSKQWSAVPLVLGLAVWNLAALDCWGEARDVYPDGREVTVVLPPTSFEEVETRNSDQPGNTYEVVVSFDDRGELVLGGDPMWRSRSLPVVVAGRVASVKTSKRAKETKLTVDGDGSTFVFRIPIHSAWQQPLGEVLVLGHSSVSSPSGGLGGSLDRMLDAFCAHQFSPPLDSLDMRIRRRVAELQFAVGATGPPSTSILDGMVYFDARLGEGSAVYNRLTSSVSQRTTNTVVDRVLPAVKAWAQVFFGEVPFAGIRFTATVTHKDFTEYPPEPGHDELELLVSLADAEAYADEDLTAQELIDASVVSVNGRRVEVNLSAR
jgi:hypothetical protein